MAQEGDVVGLEGRNVEEPVDRGREQHQHDERLAEPVQHAVQVVQALHERQPGSGEGPVLEQRDLDRAEAPARPLRDVFGQPFGREADAQPLVEPAGHIAVAHHRVGEIDVLRHGLVRKAADLLQPVAADQEGGADAEGRVPGVLGGLEHVEEDALVVDPGLGGHQVVLDRVGVEVELRSLHHPDPLVVEEADRPLEQVRVGREIGIEHEDQGRGIRPASSAAGRC